MLLHSNTERSTQKNSRPTDSILALSRRLEILNFRIDNVITKDTTTLKYYIKVLRKC